MKTKRIVSILLILSMFILILPHAALARFISDGKGGISWNWVNYNKDLPFSDYASGEFTYNYMVWDEGDRDWDSYTSNYWIEEEDLQDGYYRRILINSRAAYKELNDEKIHKFKTGETHEASHLESYILSFADFDDNDDSVKEYFHDLAQEAWYDYQDGDRDSNEILDNAYDYKSWIEMLEDEMGKNISNASDDEIAKTIEGTYDFDTKDSVVSVVHEPDQDYMLISNLTVKGIDVDTIIHYFDDDGDLHSKGNFKPAVKDITIKFATEDGEKEVKTKSHSDITSHKDIFDIGMENAITLEYENLSSHISQSKAYHQNGSNGCDYSGCDSQHKLFPNLDYYPFPFGGEKINLKFSAEFIKTYKITGVTEISIVSDTSRGVLKTWYTELEEGDLSEGERKTRMDKSNFRTSEVKGSNYYDEVGVDYNFTTGSALGLVDGDSKVTVISTDEMLGMSEKSIRETENELADVVVEGSTETTSDSPGTSGNAHKYTTDTYTTNKNAKERSLFVTSDYNSAKEHGIGGVSLGVPSSCKITKSEKKSNNKYEVEIRFNSNTVSQNPAIQLNMFGCKLSDGTKTGESAIIANKSGAFVEYPPLNSLSNAVMPITKTSIYAKAGTTYTVKLKMGCTLTKIPSDVVDPVTGAPAYYKSEDHYTDASVVIKFVDTKEAVTVQDDNSDNGSRLNAKWIQFVNIGPSTTLGYAWRGGNTTGLTYSGSTLTFDGQNKNNKFTLGVCYLGTSKSTPGATASEPYVNGNAKTYDFTATSSGTYTWNFGGYNITVVLKNIPASSSSGGSNSGSSGNTSTTDNSVHKSGETKSSDGKISVRVNYKNINYNSYLRSYSQPQLNGDWYNFTLQAPDGAEGFTINGNPFANTSGYSKMIGSHSEYGNVNNLIKYTINGTKVAFNINAAAIENCVSAGNALEIGYKTNKVTEWTSIYIVKNASLTSNVSTNTVKVENTSSTSSNNSVNITTTNTSNSGTTTSTTTTTTTSTTTSTDNTNTSGDTQLDQAQATPLQNEDVYLSAPYESGDYKQYYVSPLGNQLKASLSNTDLVFMVSVDKNEGYKTESIKCTKIDGSVINIDPNDKTKVEITSTSSPIVYKIKDSDIAKYAEIVVNYSNANGKVQSSIRIDNYHNVIVNENSKAAEELKNEDSYVKSSGSGYEICINGVIYEIIPDGTYGSGSGIIDETKLVVKQDSIKAYGDGGITFEVEANDKFTISKAYTAKYAGGSSVDGWNKFNDNWYYNEAVGNSKVNLKKDLLTGNSVVIGYMMTAKNPRGGADLKYFPTVKVVRKGEAIAGNKDNSIGSGTIDGINLSFYASGAYNKDGDVIKSIDSSSIKIENGNLVFKLNDKVFSNAYLAKYNEQHAGWTKLNLSSGTIYYFGNADILTNGNQITLYNIENEIKSGMHTYYVLLKNGEYYSLITINTTGSNVKGNKVTGQNSEFKLEGVAYADGGSITINSDLKDNYSEKDGKVTFTVPYSPSKNGDSILKGDNDSKLNAEAKADGGKMIITINKSNFYSCPDGYYEVKNENSTPVSLYIHYIGTKAAASKYTENANGFIYTVNNPSSLVDIGIDTKVLYENGNNYDDSRYKNLLFPINSLAEGYSLKSWTAPEGTNQVSIDIKDNKYLRIVNGTQNSEIVNYTATFSNGSDEQTVEIIVQRTYITINQSDIFIGSNVWVEGSAGIDPDYLDKEDCDMLSITGNSDFVINNLDMKKYFNEGEITNEQLKEKLSDYTAYLKTDTPVDLGIENEDYTFLIIEKPGFLKRDGKHYVQLKFEMENAISYEVNYRYVTNSGFYAGDGYKGQMLTTPNGHSIHYTDKNEIATFYVERAGFSVITVKFNDNSIKNIGVFVPQMYIGEISKDGDSYKNYNSYDKDWHGQGENPELLYKAAQFYVDLNDEEEQELVFYNITGDVELSDYVVYPEAKGDKIENSKPVKGSEGDWMSSKKMWDEYGDDSSIARSEEDNSISQKYMLKEGYRDIEGFGDETEFSDDDANEDRVVKSNYFLNTDTNSHELRWSFRDSGIEEENTDSIGSTLFTIVFRGQEQDEGDLETPLTYLKQIEEFAPSDLTKKYEADYEGQWSFTYNIRGDVFIDVPDDKKDYDDGYGIHSTNDTPVTSDVWVILEEYSYNNNQLIASHVKPDYEVKEGKYSFNVLPPLSTDGTKHYYSVKTVYDGQKFEPTEFLATSGITVGNTDERENRKNTVTGIDPGYESKAYYSDYENSSWIAENSGIRHDFDSKDLEIITKDDQQVNYNKDDGSFGYVGVGYEDSTTNNDLAGSDINGDGEFAKSIQNSKHYIYASTNDGGLKLPLRDDNYHLKNTETASLKIMREDNPSGEKHVPIMEYSDNINIGLVYRDDSDLAVNRDVYKASVVINEQDMNYKYNSLKLKPNENGEIPALSKTYNLGLYSSDIEYSSSVYSEAKAIEAIKDATEFRAFVTYKITLLNESANTIEKVNELSEYYKNSDNLTLVDDSYSSENSSHYSFNDGLDAVVIQKTPSEGENKYTISRTPHRVADTSYYRVIRSGNSDYGYNYNKAGDLEGFDNNSGKIAWKNKGDVGNGDSSYKHLTTDSLSEVKLNPGEMIEVYVTYELDREGFKAAIDHAFEKNGQDNSERENALVGDKNTVSEISAYSTEYGRRKNNTTAYKVGENSGKIDRDSRPGNVDLSLENKYQEDDTSYAGKLHVGIEAEQNRIRSISGTVWDDSVYEDPNAQDGTKHYKENGNGVFDSGEKGIEDIKVSLIEKVLAGNGQEYEFAWPIDGSGNIQDKEYSGSLAQMTNNNGEYKFSGVVPGTYVVRFEYGDKDSGTNEFYTGQNYKNTEYEDNMTNLNQVWQDLDTDAEVNDNKVRVSDARDYEPARLRTIAYARTISALNGSELKNGYTNGDGTYMRADTARLNIESSIEKDDKLSYVDGTGKYVKTYVTDDGTFTHEYAVENIDFGLEMRPETKIEIDKQLTKVTLSKKGTDVFRVNIEYDNNGKLLNTDRAGVSLEDGVAIDKMISLINEAVGADQGFRYVQMETEELKEMAIKLDYNIVASNKSNIDYIGSDLDKMYTMESIYGLAYNMENNDVYKNYNSIINYGTNDGPGNNGNYLGSNYYKHNTDTEGDQVVTTTVDQLVDYVDNDIAMDKNANNQVENHAWKAVNVSGNAKDELAGLFTDDSYEDDVLHDYRKVSYIDTAKSNIVLSENSNIKHIQNGGVADVIEYNIMKKDIDGKGINGYKVTLSDTKYQARYNDSVDGNYNPDSINKVLTKRLEPNDKANIGFTVSETIHGESDADNLKFDNLAEVLVYSNTAGRKDMDAIPGNANEIIVKGEGASSTLTWRAGHQGGGERDGDTTEYFTLTPPTGLSVEMERSNNSLVVTIIAAATAMIANITVPIAAVMYDRSRRNNSSELKFDNGSNGDDQ